MKALIALEDGTVFEGRSAGIEGEQEGEIVFNTSMTGYQEIITDPSYKGQIVTMTYPLIGNYGVNDEDVESKGPKVQGFVAREFSRITSNFRANEDLLDYLARHRIMAIEEVDTRALTKHLRVRGAMRAMVSTRDLDPESLVRKARDSIGIMGVDLVKEVTCESAHDFDGEEPPLPGMTGHCDLSVVVMDFGVKVNILRMLRRAGCRVMVVPARTSAARILAMKPDGVLLSNGPGDPEAVPDVVDEIRKLFGKVPIFGICLGQQLLGLAYGGKTYKLKFGHRGGNQPIKHLTTGKVSITSENHGFAVDLDSLPREQVKATHVNLNDGTLEGMEHEIYPIFSVQFHPEASPGPHDSYGLFRKFRQSMEAFRKEDMPKRTDIKSIFLIGSGPIVIGQACEFDYSGSQACKALKEEGYRIILINSNPATIMTDPTMADRTYVEPLIPEVLEAIIEAERPDALLPTLGGQTGLNLATVLSERGVLEKYHVELIGADYKAIKKAEDREEFKTAMERIGLEVPRSGFAYNSDQARKVVKEIGFPAIIRPSYTLGGTGAAIAYNIEEFELLAARGIESSMINEILIEESVIGWKEYELEVMRDTKDNVVIICSIENFDPMGVHTGDSDHRCTGPDPD